MTLQRVVGIDSAFLAAETSEWLFHVSALHIVDRRSRPDFDFEAYRRLLGERIHLIPQFRWRLHPPPLGLGWTYLADDPEFDLDNHLRHAVAPLGDRAALGRFVGDLISQRLDRRHPLWESWYLEGDDPGRVAILLKVHHAIIDGVSAVEAASAMYDVAPSPPERSRSVPYRPAPSPPALEISARNAGHGMGVAMRIARLSRDLVAQATDLLPAISDEPPPALPFQAPRTIFNGQLTGRRGFASASLALDRFKRVKEAAGVKLNDVLLAVTAGALRSFLADQEELPARPLVAQVPVSTRPSGRRGHVGTQVGSMFVSLATDVDDPWQRLKTIHASSSSAKAFRDSLAQHRTIGITDALPPAVVGAAARAWSLAHLDGITPPIYNVIVSNVAGPPVDFYVAGARIEAMYLMGPLLYGGGLNITAFTNGPTVDVGIVTCRDLLADPWPLADRFEPALDELVAAASRPKRRVRREAS